jgi:hypothetical protein
MTELAPEDLRPAEVHAYLKSRGWHLVRNVSNGSIWSSPPELALDETLTVFVPENTEFGDYARRLLDVVASVSEAEHRSEGAVVRDLVETSSDVIRFELPFSFPDASVPFADALTLFQRAREAMRAAALAAFRPNVPAYAPGGNPREVESFLRELRLGHTEPGSYVVPVIAPLGTVEAAPEEVVPRTDEPFGRFVTLRLNSALSALESTIGVARETNDVTVFRETVTAGVSANLCEAMSALTRTARAPGSEVEHPAVGIWFSWSPSRAVPEQARDSFAIRSEDSSVLEDAAQLLKRMEIRQRATVVGQVVRLERELDEPEGTIGIRGRVDDGQDERMVVVRLSPHEYERALRAHDLRLEVTCSGVLERRGTHARLVEPIEFIAPDALF